MTTKTDAIIQDLRAWGLTYPGAHLKSPWPGHLDLAVKDKTFAYLSLDGQPIGVGVKLPQSNEKALMLPVCTPMAYGLGKSGWVSAQFAEGEIPPVDLLRDWIDESYRAQAPKTLVKQCPPKGPPSGGPVSATSLLKTSPASAASKKAPASSSKKKAPASKKKAPASKKKAAKKKAKARR